MYIKYIIYFFHIFYIFCTLFLPFIYTKFIFLQFFTILSWKINRNRCLLTQMEYYLNKETLINFIYKNKKKPKFIVPFEQRMLLYLFFLLNIFLYFINIY